MSKYTKAATWMIAVELGGVKTGGLSLTSEMSMFRMTVEDMAGEPLSKACTDREYLDTWVGRREQYHLYVSGETAGALTRNIRPNMC